MRKETIRMFPLIDSSSPGRHGVQGTPDPNNNTLTGTEKNKSMELIKKRTWEAVRINERNDVKANKILKDVQSDIIKELGEEAVAYLPSS